MRQVEVVVTVLLESFVETVTKVRASVACGAVPVHRVVLEAVGRRQVDTAAEPPRCRAILAAGEEEAPAAPPEDIALLREIRDSLNR